MKIRSAVLTGVTGLMLTAGLGTDLSAQSVYRYPNNNNRMAQRAMRSEQQQARQMVRQAYREVLRREPDASGMRQYTDAMLNRGWSYDEVRRNLMQSDEYAQRFGSRRWRGLYR